jgi:hypothetical protein
VSLFAIVVLVAAAALVAAAEWPRLARLAGARRRAQRLERKARLRVVRSDEQDEFARSVERDLAALPTIDEHDARKR